MKDIEDRKKLLLNSYQKNVFVMMRYRDDEKFSKIEKTIREILRT